MARNPWRHTRDWGDVEQTELQQATSTNGKDDKGRTNYASRDLSHCNLQQFRCQKQRNEHERAFCGLNSLETNSPAVSVTAQGSPIQILTFKAYHNSTISTILLKKLTDWNKGATCLWGKHTKNLSWFGALGLGPQSYWGSICRKKMRRHSLHLSSSK